MADRRLHVLLHRAAADGNQSPLPGRPLAQRRSGWLVCRPALARTLGSRRPRRRRQISEIEPRPPTESGSNRSRLDKPAGAISRLPIADQGSYQKLEIGGLDRRPRRVDLLACRDRRRERITGTVVAIYGSLAILLAAVGIFGLLSFSVGERRREIGIRMALGAQRESILRRVVGEGMRPVALGAALGLFAAFLAGGLLEGFLYGVRPNDPATHAAVAVVLISVAFAACWLPARTAASLEPVSVLRDE